MDAAGADGEILEVPDGEPWPNLKRPGRSKLKLFHSANARSKCRWQSLRQQTQPNAAPEELVRHPAMKTDVPLAVAFSRDNLKTRVIHMRCQDQRTGRSRARIKAYDNISEFIAPKAKPVFLANGFHLGPHGVLEIGRGGLPHQSSRDAAQVPAGDHERRNSSAAASAKRNPLLVKRNRSVETSAQPRCASSRISSFHSSRISKPVRRRNSSNGQPDRKSTRLNSSHG